LAVEAAEKFWIGAEFFGASAELAYVAEYDSQPTVGGSDYSSDIDVVIAISVEVAYVFAVGREADDGEPAGFVRLIGWAHVKEAGAVGQFDDVIDVGDHAHVSVWQLGGCLRRDALRTDGFLSGCCGCILRAGRGL